MNTKKKTRKILFRKYKVGYTMRDIRYKWNEGPNSVGVSSEVSLPQFKVLGHRQRAMEISLTTGRSQQSVDRTSAYLQNNLIKIKIPLVFLYRSYRL